MGSWKTTVGGIGSILAGLALILKGVAGDGEADFAAAVAAIMAGIGLLAARDNGVRSESVGAK